MEIRKILERLEYGKIKIDYNIYSDNECCELNEFKNFEYRISNLIFKKIFINDT